MQGSLLTEHWLAGMAGALQPGVEKVWKAARGQSTKGKWNSSEGY